MSSQPSVERGRRWNDEIAQSRRFHAFVVGLAKTGTSSLAESFAAYRAGHEFMFQEAVEQTAAWRSGRLSAADFGTFLQERDRASLLELDSASFHHFYFELLIPLFPAARFIYTVRDCFSWVESFLQMMLRNRQRYAEPSAVLPRWQVTLGELMVGRFDPEVFVSHEACAAALPEIVDEYLRYWAIANEHVLSRLPEARSLVVRTSSLSTALPEIARFVGADERELMAQGAHANRGNFTASLLQSLDRSFLLERARRHCATLMARLFPEISLAE